MEQHRDLNPDDLAPRLVQHIQAEKDRLFEELSEITSYNSVHSNPETAEDHAAACRWVENKLREHGLEVEIFSPDGGAPIVLGTKPAVEGAPTVLLYSHYDVVPAGDPAKWTTDPFTLSEYDGRWHARGAADCKGNLVMHLATLRAVQEFGGTSLGIKMLVEGSEEMGGAELSALIQQQPELFASDVILIADTGNVAVGEPTLTTSLRGGARITVQVDTLKTPVHSGSFGGAAPDATAALIRLLDTLRDEHGRTVIDGVDTSKRWKGEPYNPQLFREDAGMLEGTSIMGTEEDNPADMVWARPAITVIGFSSTPVEQAVNAVPATAQARLNLRVPPGMDAAELAERVVQHLEAHVPWGAKLTTTVDDVNAPFSATIESPAITALDACLASAYERTATAKVGAGGSIPLCSELLEAHPDAELALFGVEEPQCTIHSPNESVDPTEIIRVAAAEAAFLLTYRGA